MVLSEQYRLGDLLLCAVAGLAPGRLFPYRLGDLRSVQIATSYKVGRVILTYDSSYENIISTLTLKSLEGLSKNTRNCITIGRRIKLLEQNSTYFG